MITDNTNVSRFVVTLLARECTVIVGDIIVVNDILTDSRNGPNHHVGVVEKVIHTNPFAASDDARKDAVVLVTGVLLRHYGGEYPLATVLSDAVNGVLGHVDVELLDERLLSQLQVIYA